jgi:hypothetical protein
MADKNPLDDIVDDLVVFKHEDHNHPDGHYFSNNPMWNDSRIRDHWLARHSDEAKVAAQESDDPDGVGDDDDDDQDELEYAEMTNEQLRTELATRGLSVDGKKVELIARLEKNDEEAAAEGS